YLRRFGVSPLVYESALPDGIGDIAVHGRQEACPEADKLAGAARSYRILRARNGGPDLEDWLRTLSGGSNYVRVFHELYHADPSAADRLACAVTQFPIPSTNFLGFNLRAELGRGAFGKVYLATQGDLADRLVVVKVSTELFGESQTLAQL